MMPKVLCRVSAALALLQVVSFFGIGQSVDAQQPSARPHIDLAFCIDTTGSMQNEIDSVKSKTKEIVAKLANAKPVPVIRVGLVAYRDRGDAYVTKIFPFNENIDQVVSVISTLKADGGGDTPESLNEGLHAAVNDLQWDRNSKTVKLLFLIADAGPKYYPDDYDWKQESRNAIASGIQINTVGCQGLESGPAGAVDVFKEIARLADGKYEPLSYRQQVMIAGGRKETLMSSGGALYRLKVDAPTAWKLGAAALSARGDAELIGSGSLKPIAASASSRISADADRYLGERKENNLADLVLDATKKAASEKLNLRFSEK